MPEAPQATKVWYKSTAIIGAVTMVVGFIVHKFAPSIQIADADITELVAILMEAVGTVLAIRGRVKANTALTATK